jgi:hypothetical protein
MDDRDVQVRQSRRGAVDVGGFPVADVGTTTWTGSPIWGETREFRAADGQRGIGVEHLDARDAA